MKPKLAVIIFFVMFIPFSAYVKLIVLKKPDTLKTASATTKKNNIKIGDTIADLTIPDMSRTEVSLQTEVSKHKLTLINVWATWCGPCRQEMPQLIEIYKKFKDNGFGVISISTDDKRYKLDDFLKEMPLPFLVLHDLKNSISKTYAIEAIPTSIIVKESGEIVKVIVGADPEQIEAEVKKWLIQ